jgi:hypothetical protein
MSQSPGPRRALWDSVDPTAVPAPSAMTSAGGGESVGAKRRPSLRPGDARRFEDYKVEPNLWSGLGAVRPGPTVGIVGRLRSRGRRTAGPIYGPAYRASFRPPTRILRRRSGSGKKCSRAYTQRSKWGHQPPE